MTDRIRTIKKVYVAASWATKEKEAREIAQHVMRKGHVLTSGWIFFEDYEGLSREELDACIRSMDIGGVIAADEIIIFTDVESTKGGYHTELGIALGYNESWSEFTKPKVITTIGKTAGRSGFYGGLKNYPTIAEFKKEWS